MGAAHRELVVSAALGLVIGCGEVSASEQRPAEGGAGADAGPHPNVPCVDVSRVGPYQSVDLRVIGSGFDTYEGSMVRILVTHGEPEYGLGEAPIRGGAFDIFLPGVLGDYTGMAVHVDSVRDGVCDADTEPFWQATTGPLSSLGRDVLDVDAGNAYWEITPGELRILPEAGPCNLNGIFDLRVPLWCPARD
jgi:hypothetical protein